MELSRAQRWTQRPQSDCPKHSTPQIGSVAPKHTMLLDSGAPFDVNLQGPFA